jgi:protein involved in polysaccharide export with SLBB domain
LTELITLRIRSLVLTVVLAMLVLPQPGRAQQKAADYVIGAQDVLTITVWDQADLSGKFTVEADGSFSFPLIGRVKAAGLTLRAFEAELKKRLADGYFRNPQVSVVVEEYRSRTRSSRRPKRVRGPSRLRAPGRGRGRRSSPPTWLSAWRRPASGCS